MEPTEPGLLLSSPVIFFDALDFFSQEETLTLDPNENHYSLSSSPNLSPPPPPPPPPPPSFLRRRRSSLKRSTSTETHTRILHEITEEEAPSSSTLTTDGTTATSRDQSLEVTDGGSSSSSHPLISIASFLIKLIFFQINLLFRFFSIPTKLLWLSFSLLCDPFGTLIGSRIRAKGWFLMISKFLVGRIAWGRLALRLALGCFWSAYVGLVLVGILVMAFLGGSLLMRSVVEEPLRMERDLSFDYTKASPDALVPLGSQWENNQRLQLVVKLTLPESEYNWNLGVFQVRAEFLSANGEIIHSSSQPCMLRYKSSYIRLVETFLKSGSLLTGYSSESQIIKIKMTGLSKLNQPTACIRVILEQWAEYKPGAGIPQIYAASLEVNLELPLLKRIIWNWRRTVFVWVGMGLFILELLIVLVCCRPMIVPRTTRSSEFPSRT